MGRDDEREHRGFGPMMAVQKGRWLDGGGSAVGGGGAGQDDGQDPPPLDSYFQGGRAMQGKSAVIGDGNSAPPVAELVRIESDSRDAQILTALIAPEMVLADQPPAALARPGVYFWPQGILGAANGGGDPIVAILEWGIGGYQSQAEVDVGQGVCVSLPASFLIIKARLDLGIATHAPGFHPFSTVGAFVSRDSMGGSNKPQRTRYLNPALIPLAVGGVATFFVPPFARALTLERRAGVGGAAMTVDFRSSTTSPYRVLIPAGVSAGPTKLSSDIVFVDVTNDGPGVIADMRAMFELAL